MKKQMITVIAIALVVGGLVYAMVVRAPKTPTPTTEEIWAQVGIPVETALITLGDMERTVEVTGDVEALDKVMLSAKLSGRVAKVYAREGDRVSAGQTVVLLDQEDAVSGVEQAEGALRSAKARLSQARTHATVTKIQTHSAIEQADASLAAAKARLAVVKDPARSQEIMVARNNVKSAQANLDKAEADYKRHKQLLDEGAISQSAFDVVETQYRVEQAQFESAEQQLSLIEEGGRGEDVLAAQSQVEVAQEQLRAAKANASQNLVRKEDINSAQAGVKQAKAVLALAQHKVSYCYIKSPISGELASRLTEPGQVVAAGQALGEVVNLASVYFKGDISETELAGIKQRQRVRVVVDAQPGKTFTGTVARIYPAGSALSRNFPVRIEIDSATKLIKPGMFARGEIITGASHDVLLVPKDAIEERRGTKMVFTVESRDDVPESGKDKGKHVTVDVVKRHDVVVLHEGRDYVQVRPVGLEVGDTVVTRGRQNLQDGDKVSVTSDTPVSGQGHAETTYGTKDARRSLETGVCG